MPDNAALDRYHEELFLKGNYPSPFYGVYHHETKGSKNRATEGSTYYGPMQIGPAAAKEYGIDRYDPYKNIEGGLRKIGRAHV